MVWFQKLYGSDSMRMYTSNMFQIVDADCMDDNMDELARSGGCDLYSYTTGTVRLSGE